MTWDAEKGSRANDYIWKRGGREKYRCIGFYVCDVLKALIAASDLFERTAPRRPEKNHVNEMGLVNEPAPFPL